MPDIVASIQDYTPEALADFANEVQREKGVRIDGATLMRDMNLEEKKDELNFSSELEIDERFDQA